MQVADVWLAELSSKPGRHDAKQLRSVKRARSTELGWGPRRGPWGTSAAPETRDKQREMQESDGMRIRL